MRFGLCNRMRLKPRIKPEGDISHRSRFEWWRKHWVGMLAPALATIAIVISILSYRMTVRADARATLEDWIGQFSFHSNTIPATIRSAPDADRPLVVPLEWEFIIANTGATPIILFAGQYWLETPSDIPIFIYRRFYTKDGQRLNLPHSLYPGDSLTLVLRTPLPIRRHIASLIEECFPVGQVTTLKEIETYLANEHGLDLCGNPVLLDPAGSGSFRSVHPVGRHGERPRCVVTIPTAKGSVIKGMVGWGMVYSPDAVGSSPFFAVGRWSKGIPIEIPQHPSRQPVGMEAP